MVDAPTSGLSRIALLMADWHRPWGFAGGWAIDLCHGLGDPGSRPHKDIDIAVLRCDQLALQAHLTEHDWSLHIAHKGNLEPWPAGEYLELPRHVVWCRNPEHDPDFLEALLDEADVTRFLYRKDPSITLDVDRAFVRSASGLPLLAPEIVLLFKSRDAAMPENAADFRLAAPSLDAARRAWLAAAIAKLTPSHPWLADL